MGLWASFSQDVTHGIKKNMGKKLTCKAKGKRRTCWMIAHCHHPLMVRMKVLGGCRWSGVGSLSRARASQLTGKMTTTQVGHIWVT